MWVCGLKHNAESNRERGECVAPYVGVWIETELPVHSKIHILVAPYVGVWIETSMSPNAK